MSRWAKPFGPCRYSGTFYAAKILNNGAVTRFLHTQSQISIVLRQTTATILEMVFVHTALSVLCAFFSYLRLFTMHMLWRIMYSSVYSQYDYYPRIGPLQHSGDTIYGTYLFSSALNDQAILHGLRKVLIARGKGVVSKIS